MPPRSKNNKKNNSSSNNSNSNSNKNNDLHTKLDRMPIAKAVLNNNTKDLEQIIETSLLQNNSNKNKRLKVKNLTLEKSVGEAFTGGRSCPVYNVHAQVAINNNNNNGGNSAAVVIKDRYFVIKLVIIEGNDDDAKKKDSIRIKRESYSVERRFYEHIVPKLKQHSIAVPKLLASDDNEYNNNNNNNHPDNDDIKPSVHCWIMTDVRVQFPLHPTVLNTNEHMLWSALDWLARLHALYWKDPVGEWRRVVWERGGFWNKKGSFNNVQENSLSTTWLQTCQWMSTKHEDLLSTSSSSSSIRTLGTRMYALRQPLAKFMANQSKSTWSTLIHGDFKAANLFFSKQGDDDNDDDDGNNNNNNNNNKRAAAAVDFQYCGSGVPAEDVAYLLFPDAFIDYWVDENQCLMYYHERLMEELIVANKGGPSSLPFESFMALYELSRLELLIYWITKGWVGSTTGDAKLVLAIEETVSKIDGGKVLLGGMEEYRDSLHSFVKP